MRYKPTIYCNWLKSNKEYSVPIEIFVDRIPDTLKNSNVVRIILIQESFNTKQLVNFVDEYRDAYDYVFTWSDEILKKNKKAIKFLCINTWISNYGFPEKEFSVSTLVGGKNISGLNGHKLRHELWWAQEQISIPKKFYLSSHYKYNVADYKNNLILFDKKDPLFDSMFHIAIENESRLNVFTEKLIDCFQTKTIPVYWGAKNIDKYFNVEGMFIVDSVEEIINVTNNLTPQTYQEKLQYVEENYLRSMDYISHTEILDKKLTELLN